MRSARPAFLVLALLTTLTFGLLSPTAAQAARSTSKVSVLTFNVCGHAAGCGSWTKRENAVVKRIVDAKADVVAVQETWGVLSRLEQRLAPYGYAKVADSGNEGMFAKTSKLSPVTVPTTNTSCELVTFFLDPSVDTSMWERRLPQTDDAGNTWYWSSRKGWTRSSRVCTDSIVQTPKVGQTVIAPGGRAGAAWAMLKVKKTGKTYLFVSAHLSTGKNGAAGKRNKEAVRLLAVTAAAAEGRPRVFAGDFNSSIQRGKDTVGKRFEKAGFSDAYTKTKKRKGTKYNTATGYGKKPATGGSHIDRVMLPRGAAATRWEVLVKVRGGKAVKPVPSDHAPVRVSTVLP
ncbi:endonuclease/exonuclease/phosphatase family protein [Aeromicrobium wangtongii]|uniref:endonuclease/exonuclease/phosphatase family protein n=1 Tax=Aeromicrobium wangtongii TaxID=2969247 RepID=UPI002016C296|nr:endonuclease/exonuclease/phosphatase family protein [Aeromicrobium wangtongii]MCL3818396.1 endonuclease/exonuclease/phosphatase family protein [Aeromicrobium wangtongii]